MSSKTSSLSSSSSPVAPQPPQQEQRKRKNRWGAPVAAPQQAPIAAAGVAPTSSASIVEPYVSDSEAMAALVASSSSSNAAPLSNKHDKTSDNNRSNDISNKRQRQSQQAATQNGSQWGKLSKDQPDSTATATGTDSSAAPIVEKEKPNFAVSGALATDTKTGNIYKGILLKFHEPTEARVPLTKWRLYVFSSSSNNPPSSSSTTSATNNNTEIFHISKQSA